jgi:hypothetical protein
MKPTFLILALAALALLPAVPARADNNGYPYQGRANYTIDGTIRHIDSDHSRIALMGDDGARYTVDTSNSDIILPSGASTSWVEDLSVGETLHVVGTLLDGSLIEANRVRAIPADTTDRTTFTDAHADYENISPTDNNTTSAPPPAAATFEVNGMVRSVDPASDHITIIDANDNRFTVDTYGSDVILADIGRTGHCSDLSRGMHVRISGSQLANGIVVADRVRVVSDSDLTAANVAPLAQPIASAHDAPVVAAPLAPVITAPVVSAPVYSAPPAVIAAPVQSSQVNVPTNYTPQDFPQVDLDDATGILIDCRDTNILRSPSPSIVGPDNELLYPDRSDVPTPDEVQDESIVRYYRTLSDAEAGVGGDHPLILHAIAVVGPAQDGVELSAQDMALFIALNKRLNYMHTWKVGFLVPPDK